MDFERMLKILTRTVVVTQWNRLIGASPASAQKQKRTEDSSPEAQLARFKRIWQSLLHAWRNGRENDPQAQEVIRGYIKRLTDLLIEDEKRPVRLCMQFAYDQQVYIAISRVAQTNGSPEVIKEAINAFSTLVENEDEGFMTQQNFAQSLIGFLQHTSHMTDRTYESEFVEFLFGIAAKIRLNPEILPVWFTTPEDQNYRSLGRTQRFEGVSNKEEFPLFYLLLDYVHHDGRVGDFARTGLLYIIEAASSSLELERWIVESDLATLMASGLGALYSQLSRKLVIAYSKEDPPDILVLSDYSSEAPSFGAETTESPDFKTHLDTFLSYLVFWQDVLEHCHSSEVKQTLLDHFQVLFLQQLLYPSLLESSDVDGGSSVAVLTYLRVILDTLEHKEIIKIILTYLLSLPYNIEPARSPTSPSAIKRKKSLDLLSSMTADSEQEQRPTPELYNLVDLILTSLKSSSQLTVSATLRLLSTIVQKHHPYAVSTLLKVVPYDSEKPQPTRTIGALRGEMDMFFSMISEISEDEDREFMAESYNAYIKDTWSNLESHQCSIGAIASKSNPYSSMVLDPVDQHLNISTHMMRSDDPVLRCIVALLERFFLNTVETNLMLTAVIVDLATCYWTRLEGWLLCDPSSYKFDIDSDDSDAESEEGGLGGEPKNRDDEDGDLTDDEDIEMRQLKGMQQARKVPGMLNNSPIIKALESLMTQLKKYKNEIPDLAEKLAERKKAFRFADNLNEALLSSPTAGTPSGYPVSPGYPHKQQQGGNLRAGRSKNIMVDPTGSPRQSPSDAGYATPPRGGVRPGGRSVLSPIRTPVSSRGMSPAARGAALSSPFGNHLADTQRKVRPVSWLTSLPPEEITEMINAKGVITMKDGRPTVAAPGADGAAAAGAGADRSATATPTNAAGNEQTEDAQQDFTLSHLLTNIMILQEFLKELAALIQVRSSLFAEVSFVVEK